MKQQNSKILQSALIAGLIVTSAHAADSPEIRTPAAAPTPVPIFVPQWHPVEATSPAGTRPDGVVLILRDEEDSELRHSPGGRGGL